MIIFYDLPPCMAVWSLLSILGFIYDYLNVCPFDCTAVAGESKCLAIKPEGIQRWLNDCCRSS